MAVGLQNAALNPMADALAALLDFMSLHTAEPDGTGSNESTAGRQALSWDAAVNGDISLSAAENFTGGAASGACTHAGFWSLGSGGTFYGAYAITGDQTFNSAGEYTVTDATITGDNA